MVTMTYTKNGKTYHCSVEAALDVIGGKWKPLILWALGDNVLRFGELQKELSGINTKMLTKQLRELEQDGLSSGRSILKCRPMWNTVSLISGRR